MVRLWDETGGFRAYEPTTRVYRGAEIVWNNALQAWDIWWLPVSGREGRVGRAASVLEAERLLDSWFV